MKIFKRLLSFLLLMVMLITVITSTGIVTYASMLPLKEVKAYLALNGYSQEELSAMPVDNMLLKISSSCGYKANYNTGSSSMVQRYGIPVPFVR